MIYANEGISILGNFELLMRHRGKLVPSSRREGHNIFTTIGRNWLSKLHSWQTIGATDTPYTNKRVRWIGMGIGAQLESPTVSGLAQSVLATATNFLVPIQSVEFPTSTSARFIKEFLLNELTVTSTPVILTESGLFADVSPAQAGALSDGTEDVPNNPGVVDTVLNPASGSNPPIAYKAFEPVTKTVDFTLEVRWDFRIE